MNRLEQSFLHVSGTRTAVCMRRISMLSKFGEV